MAAKLASKTCFADFMGYVIRQTRFATLEKAEHTLNVLTSLEIGDTSGFAGCCVGPSLVYDVQSVEAHGIEKFFVLRKSMQDDGNHWHRWDGQRYQTPRS